MSVQRARKREKTRCCPLRTQPEHDGCSLGFGTSGLPRPVWLESADTLNSKPRNPTRPPFLFHTAELVFLGHEGPGVDSSFVEMSTSRPSSPKKRQTRPKVEENGSSQSSGGRMEPVFQALLNPFRHRKDSSKLFTEREFAHGPLKLRVYVFYLTPGHQLHLQ